MENKNTEKKQKDAKIPTDVGVDRQWLEAILKRDVKKPKAWTEKDIKEMVATKAPSQIQGIIQDIYWSLTELGSEVKFTWEGEPISMPDEDYFDDWYDSAEIDKYSQKYKLQQVLNTIARAVHISEVDGYAKEDSYDTENLRKSADFTEKLDERRVCLQFSRIWIKRVSNPQKTISENNFF